MTDVQTPDLQTDAATPALAVRRLSIKTIPADEVMAGGWIRMRAMKVAESDTFKQMIRLTQELVSSGTMTPEQNADNEKALRTFVCSLILEWNWVDEEGQPLPQPFNNPAVFELLTDEEASFLMEAVMTGGKKKHADDLEIIEQYLNVGNTIDPETGLKRDLPWIYSELRLCRDVYHCLPSELDEQDFDRIQMHIAIMNAEADADALKKQHTKKK